MLHYAWIIPAVPVVSFLLILLFGKRLPRGGAEVGIAAVALSFVLSIVALTVVFGGTALAASTTKAPKHSDAKADTALVKKLAPSLSVNAGYAPLTVSIRGRASDLPVRVRT